MKLKWIVIVLILLSGCAQNTAKKVNTAAAFVEQGAGSTKSLFYALSQLDWLMSVMVLLVVAGIVLALVLKIKEGWGISLAGIAGAVLIVVLARYAVWIGLAALVLGVIVLVLKLKDLRQVAYWSVKYGEGLKKILPAEEIQKYNKIVNQPKPVERAVYELRKT